MYFLSMKTEPVTRMSGRNDKCLAQKPDINRCIRSNCDRLAQKPDIDRCIRSNCDRLAQKPDIYRCIRSNCDRLDFYAGIQIMQGRGWET